MSRHQGRKSAAEVWRLTPITACGHRVRFAGTWREEFFEASLSWCQPNWQQSTLGPGLLLDQLPEAEPRIAIKGIRCPGKVFRRFPATGLARVAHRSPERSSVEQLRVDCFCKCRGRRIS